MVSLRIGQIALLFILASLVSNGAHTQQRQRQATPPPPSASGPAVPQQPMIQGYYEAQEQLYRETNRLPVNVAYQFTTPDGKMAYVVRNATDGNGNAIIDATDKFVPISVSEYGASENSDFYFLPYRPGSIRRPVSKFVRREMPDSIFDRIPRGSRPVPRPQLECHPYIDACKGQYALSNSHSLENFDCKIHDIYESAVFAKCKKREYVPGRMRDVELDAFQVESFSKSNYSSTQSLDGRLKVGEFVMIKKGVRGFRGDGWSYNDSQLSKIEEIFTSGEISISGKSGGGGVKINESNVDLISPVRVHPNQPKARMGSLVLVKNPKCDDPNSQIRWAECYRAGYIAGFAHAEVAVSIDTSGAKPDESSGTETRTTQRGANPNQTQQREVSRRVEPLAVVVALSNDRDDTASITNLQQLAFPENTCTPTGTTICPRDIVMIKTPAEHSGGYNFQGGFVAVQRWTDGLISIVPDAQYNELYSPTETRFFMTLPANMLQLQRRRSHLPQRRPDPNEDNT